MERLLTAFVMACVLLVGCGPTQPPGTSNSTATSKASLALEPSETKAQNEKPSADSLSTPLNEQQIESLAQAYFAESQGRVTDELIKATRSKHPRVKVAAARALGRLAPEHPSLELLRQDNSESVRAAATFARLSAPGMLPTTDLLAYLGDAPSDDQKIQAALALRLRAEPVPSSWMLELLADPSSDVQASAALALSRIPESARFMDRLIELVETGEPIAQYAASSTLAHWLARPNQSDLDRGQREALTTQFTKWVDHPRSSVRLSTARALTRPTSSFAQEALAKLTMDTDLRVRFAALQGYRFTNVSLTTGPVAQSLTSEDPRRSYFAIKALEANKTGVASEMLVDLIINGSSPWVQEEAIRSLNLTNPGLGVDVANGLTISDNPAHRAAAAGSFATLLSDKAFEYANRLWNDQDPRVRGAAVATLLYPTNENADEMLQKVLADESPGVERALLRWIETRITGITADEASIQEAVELLQQLWQREDSRETREIRLRTLRMIERLSPMARDPFQPFIESAVSDTDARVRLLGEKLGGTQTNTVDPYFDLETCRKIAEWSLQPRTLVLQVEREGFAPGSFHIELDVEHSPRSAWWFYQKAMTGEFNGLIVDDLIPGEFVRFGPADPGRTPGYPPAPLGEPFTDIFQTGTVALLGLGPNAPDARFFISLAPRPMDYGRFTPIGKVVKNLLGTTWRLLPGDKIVGFEEFEAAED